MNLLSLFTLFSPHRTQISMTHSLTHPPVSNTGWVFLGLTVARFAVQVERWSELSEPAKNDAGAAVWLQPAGSGQFYLYMRVCVCGFSLCQPAGHGSSHWEATYWRAACQWPEKQEEEGKKWDSPPVTGTTTWRTEAAKIPETKKNPSDQTCLKSWKHPVWLVHVSHGITDFWCHPVGHFEGIFFPLPSQNNLNKFSAAYFNFQSIFDVLFVWLCLPECKKKRKKNLNVHRPSTTRGTSSLCAVGTYFNLFFFGGDQSELPSCFAPSKHQMHETRKLVEGRPVGSGSLVMSISTVNGSIFFFS